MEGGKYLKLNDIGAYKISFHLSNYVWGIVINWNHFTKSTVGIQWTTAMDSMSANIAEGFGRYFKKDKIKFYRYSFGSLKESQDWALKSYKRKLISQTEYNYIMEELNKIPKEINSLIKYTNEKLKE
ncbi:MAG TPA: four helix bundle protein [Candidatus Magasanikbacteria bacterium]|nr:four helix bundle protein [Candidatus Magasanikbacteria bacterium]